MGVIILFIAAVLEAALGAFSIITKSNQKTIRSWVRIGAFAVFIIFTLVSVIEWSFRWYLLAAVLLIWTVTAGVSLTLKRADKKGYRPVPTVFKAIAMWLIASIAVAPALIFPQYKLPGTTGGYKVDTVIYTYTDNNRIETFNNSGTNRRITAEFWYPENADGRYPLVLFSHGAFGVRTSNTSTFKELASNGYVVCSIDHPYHSFYTSDTDGNRTLIDKAFMQEVIDVNNGVYDNKTVYNIENKWMKLRTDDMNFVLDTIIKNAKSDSSNKVYRLIDTGKIGLLGHSLGGAAGAKLGRDRSDIGAVINLDGDLLGEWLGVVDGKDVVNNKVYPVPMLGIYTDTMEQLFAGITDADIVIPQKRISATAPDAYEVYISGTNHMSLTDLPLASPFLADIICGSIKKADGGHGADKYYVIETMNRIVLEFFNSYLKGKGSFHSAGTY